MSTFRRRLSSQKQSRTAETSGNSRYSLDETSHFAVMVIWDILNKILLELSPSLNKALAEMNQPFDFSESDRPMRRFAGMIFDSCIRMDLNATL